MINLYHLTNELREVVREHLKNNTGNDPDIGGYVTFTDAPGFENYHYVFKARLFDDNGPQTILVTVTKLGK